MTAERVAKIRAAIERQFAPQLVEVFDDSAAHAGHAGAASGGGHFRVTVVSEAFAGRNRIERHRMVFAAMGELMQTDIHALNIVARTPTESTT